MDIIRRFGRRVPGSNPGGGVLKCPHSLMVKQLPLKQLT